MTTREITSRDNPAVKDYVLISTSRKERRERGLFVTEGVKLTCEALDAGYTAQCVYSTPDALDRYDDAQRLSLASENFYRISSSVAEKLAQSVSPQGIFGVFELPEGEKAFEIKPAGKYLILSSLQDPGNVGAILRTAAAFGIDGVIFSADCADLYSPKVLRAAMGGAFKLPVTVVNELSEAVERLRGAGISVLAAAPRGDAVSLCDAPLKNGCAVVIGNEGNGLSPALIALCDGALLIPMRADSESLNAAVAAGIILWEMTK